ncbi:MAG: hypothetical protein HZA91_08310 [Verrucomicrobia bacterium]|nr:hypothetical protein [Verrucomicrobiota bacterium]
MPMDPYSTHQPALIACVARYGGPVLELGVGWYSTPVLHAMAGAMSFDLVSVDNNAEWLARFERFRTAKHQFVRASMPADAPALVARDWSVVLVDNGVKERRPWMDALWQRARVMAAHDSEQPCYCYEPLASTAKFRFDYKADALSSGKVVAPPSFVVSNTENLDWLREALP